MRMTCAPKVASRRVAWGPTCSQVRSSTRTPSSARPLFGLPLPIVSPKYGRDIRPDGCPALQQKRSQKGGSRGLPLCGNAVAQNPARRRAGETVTFPRDLSVHNDVAVAFSALHPTPFVARQVVGNLDRQHLKPFQIVDHDICWSTLPQKAAILEPGAERGQS